MSREDGTSRNVSYLCAATLDGLCGESGPSMALTQDEAKPGRQLT